MNKTLRMLLHINTSKKNKNTYVNWKTFNAKQTGIHIPKMLAILKKINNTVNNTCAAQVKMQYSYVLSIVQNVDNMKITNEKIYNNYETKQNAFASIFNARNHNKTITNNVNIKNKSNTTALNIGLNYIMYLLLVNMYNNIKKTKTNTVTLPRKRTAYTVLKSPHADKKAREQFMKELFNVRISIKNYVATMQYMNSIVLSYTKAFIHSYKYNAFYENKI